MSKIQDAVSLLRRSKRLIIFSGAGMSADSGIDTFRGSGGFWSGLSGYFMLAYGGTPIGWNLTPSITWSMFIKYFYLPIKNASPHDGYALLVRLQNESFHENMSVITMNVDGFHQASGADASRVCEIHGSVQRFRCNSCCSPIEVTQPTTTVVKCSQCRSGYSRPDVTLFTESLPEIEWKKAMDIIAGLERNDVMLVIGTSSVVQPAAGIPKLAKLKGAKLIEINPAEETPLHALMDVHIQAGAADALREIVASLLSESEQTSTT